MSCTSMLFTDGLGALRVNSSTVRLRAFNAGVATLLTSLALVSCADQNDASNAIQWSAIQEESQKELSRLAPGEINYVPSRSTSDMAKSSDAVVSGTIASWQPGSIVEDNYGSVISASILIELTDITVQKGDLGTAPRSLFIGYGPVMDPVELAKSLPIGVQVIAYLKQPADTDYEPPEGIVVKNLEADSPGGTPAFTLSTRQGLVVDLSESQRELLYWPLTNHSQSASLAEAMPGGPVAGLSDEKRDELDKIEKGWESIRVE